MKAIVFALALLLTPQRQETGLVVQSWKYNPETKDLTLTLVNLSGKDIIAYNISISDGSTDYFGATRTLIRQAKNSDVKVVVDMVVYADSTAEVLVVLLRLHKFLF
jgi:hypothetical protein